MKPFLKKLAASQEGLEVVEYGIIAGLLVVGILTLLAAIGLWVRSTFDDFRAQTGA